MRSLMLALCHAFLLLAWSARALLALSQPADAGTSAPGARVIMDVIFDVIF
jgi:predicted metal-binding membrane protein